MYFDTVIYIFDRDDKSYMIESMLFNIHRDS